MTTKKEPSNSELIKEVRDMYTGLDGRVVHLENWKRNEDAYRAALSQVKNEELQDKTQTRADADSRRRTEILKQIGIVLGLIIAILYAYMATKGIKP